MLFWSSASPNLFRRSSLFCALALVLFSGSSAAAALVDSLGRKVEVRDHPQRVISLAPSLSEIAASLLESEIHRLVGVSEWSDFPAQVKKIQTIGPYHRFSLEKVVALKPDLVLATADGNAKEQVNHLQDLGIPVVVTRQQSLAEIADTVLLVAQALSMNEKGREIAQKYRSELLQFQKKSHSLSSQRVLLQLGDRPLVVAGAASFLNDALLALGAKNVYLESKQAYPHPSLEDALSKNPDQILILSLGADSSQDEQMRSKWLDFKTLRAVQRAQVKLIRSDELLRPTPRIVEGLKKLRQLLDDPGR